MNFEVRFMRYYIVNLIIFLPSHRSTKVTAHNMNLSFVLYLPISFSDKQISIKQYNNEA